MPPPGRAPECQICPFCAGLATLRGARPEAVEHLVKAGTELLLAAKALLEVAAPPGEPGQDTAPGRRRGRREGATGDAALARDGLQRIDIG